MSDKKEQGFANLHYPGMKADPNEGKSVMNPSARWRFEEQIHCLGEGAQKKLFNTSVFVLGTSPLGVAIVRALARTGIGRIGVFGDTQLHGASALASDSTSGLSTLQALSAWAKSETPWLQFETFRQSSIDRRVDDMVRGFDFVVSADGLGAAGQAISVARAEGKIALLAQVSGTSAWCAQLPVGVACEDCIELPVAQGQGLYFPLMEHVASLVVSVAVELALKPGSSSAFIESIDAARSPWMRETRPVSARSGCARCSPTS